MNNKMICENVGNKTYKYFIVNGVKTFEREVIAGEYALDKGIKSYEVAYNPELFKGIKDNKKEIKKSEQLFLVRTKGYAPRKERISFFEGVEDMSNIEDIFLGYSEGLVITRTSKKIDKYQLKEGVWVKEKQVILINSKNGSESVWNISELKGIDIDGSSKYYFINEKGVFFILEVNTSNEKVKLYTKDWDSNSWYVITKEEDFVQRNFVVFEYDDRRCDGLHQGWLVSEKEAYDENANFNKYSSIYEVHRLENEQQAFKYMNRVLKDFNNEKLTSFFYGI